VEMRRNRGLRGLILATAAMVCVLAGSPSFAQTSHSGTIAERLSPDTVLYVQWRGAAYLSDAAKKNHLLQLIEDPAMMPVWATMANNLQRSAQKQGKQGPPVSLPDLVSLLGNPFAFGVTTNGNPPSAPATSADGANAAVRYGTFLVYDDTGKTALIEKLRAAARNNGDAKAEVTHYDFGGTTVEVRATSKDKNYSAQAGPYLVTSSQKMIIEDLVTRFRNASGSGASVTQLADYGEVKRFIGSDSALEFFARVPEVHPWAASDPKNQTPGKFLSDIHAERVHVAGAGLTFEGAATRFRAAVLGDTSPGGPFDALGASSPTFQTQPVWGDGPTFNVWRLNVPAIYTLARNAIISSAPPQQAAGFLVIESMSDRFLGMPLQSALELFRGEFASVSSYAEDGTQEQLTAIPIQRPEDVLRVLRAAGSSWIVAEDSSGDATYLDIAYPYKDPQTGTQRRKFYYLAVTPQMLLAAPRKALLRQAMQQMSAPAGGAAGGGIFANGGYVQVRGLLPEKLSSLSASDIAAIPWDKVIANVLEEQSQAAQPAKGAPGPQLNQPKAAARAIPRHLRMAVSGAWKDANGVYFDSYVQ
jgi:hypothetical protein